jgi:glycosyltransferase involved in cell wall biosynthesis
VSVHSIDTREVSTAGAAPNCWALPRALRIAQVVPVYPPRRGGVGRVAQEFTVRLRERGHHVRVFTPRHPALTEIPEYVSTLAAPLRVGNAAFIPSLAWQLHGFDLVHFHYPFFGGVEPLLLRRLLRPRQALIVSYHMDAVADGLRGALFAAHQRVVLPRVLAEADCVIVSSLDYAHASAIATHLPELPRVEVHPYGVDLTRFRPGAEPVLRAALGGDAKTSLLLFVAALDPAHHFKGFPVLIDALRELRDATWRLVVVGDGASRSAHVERACAAGLGARIHFAGDVSDEDLPHYYRAADIHLFPSTAAAEAFGLVCLEAAASATPTIASALPGVRRVVLDRETGLHVPPRDSSQLRDAVRQLLDSPNLRAQFGAAARARAEAAFDWNTRITHLEDSYFSLIAASGAAARVAAV